MNTNFCQALRQLSSVPSSQLCVRLASGGDPTYSINVRFTGEEVHGTSMCPRNLIIQKNILSFYQPVNGEQCGNQSYHLFTPSVRLMKVHL